MEYFVGSFSTLIIVLVCFKLFKSSKFEIDSRAIMFTQSKSHQILKPILPSNNFLQNMKPLKTQSKRYFDKNYIRFLFLDNKAYWIKDSIFYSADIVDEKIVEDSILPVDIMGMDRVELNKMSFIVEQLTEGIIDDRSNPGIS